MLEIPDSTCPYNGAMSTETPKSEEEVAAEAPLKRKTSPSPLPMARDVGAAPRPLSPLRRAAVPLGLAGLLSVGGAAALVAASADPPCPAYGTLPSGPYTRFASGLKKVAHEIHEYISPTPMPMAGAIAPVSPVPAPIAPASINPPEDVPAATTPPAPSAVPTTVPSVTKPPKHIDPTPHHPKLGGKPMMTNSNTI